MQYPKFEASKQEYARCRVHNHRSVAAKHVVKLSDGTSSMAAQANVHCGVSILRTRMHACPAQQQQPRLSPFAWAVGSLPF